MVLSFGMLADTFPWLSRQGSSQICCLRGFITGAALSAHDPGNKWQDPKATWHYCACSTVNRESLRFVHWSRWPFLRINTAAVVVMLKYLDSITLLQCFSVALWTIKIFIHTLKSHSCHDRKALPAIPCCLWWGVHVSGISCISVREYLSAVYPSACTSVLTSHVEPCTAVLNTQLQVTGIQGQRLFFGPYLSDEVT
jgi:hypothetical protein